MFKKIYKNLKFWVGLVVIALAIFFGLSQISITQHQKQTQTQNQIVQQHNTQLTLVGLQKKITNVQWMYREFEYELKFRIFFNTELDLFQQLNSKYSTYKKHYSVVYPVINSKTIVTYTNNNTNENFQSNTIGHNLFNIFK